MNQQPLADAGHHRACAFGEYQALPWVSLKALQGLPGRETPDPSRRARASAYIRRLGRSHAPSCARGDEASGLRPLDTTRVYANVSPSADRSRSSDVAPHRDAGIVVARRAIGLEGPSGRLERAASVSLRGAARMPARRKQMTATTRMPSSWHLGHAQHRVPGARARVPCLPLLTQAARVRNAAAHMHAAAPE